MGFTWIKFGVMAAPIEDQRYVYAVNEAGETRKLSKYKYPNHQALKQKCISLIGYPTVIRTSQNTANWSTGEWFSDITLDDENVQKLAHSGSDQITESHDDLINKIKQIDQTMTSMSDRLERHITEQSRAVKEQGEQVLSAVIKAKDHELDALRAKVERMKSERKTELYRHEKQKAEFKAEAANEQTDQAIKLARNANLRAAQLQTENESLKTERQQLVEALKNERSDLSNRERKDISSANERLQRMEGLIGHEHSIKVVGHPWRTLALRAGVSMAGRNRLKVKVIEHVDANNFEVELLEHGSKKVIVALGLNDRNGLYAATFKNPDPFWFDIEERVSGLSEVILKNRLDISAEELIEHHKKVNEELYRIRSGGM